MRNIATTFGVLALLATPLQAQEFSNDELKDFAAYGGINSTTVGLITPIPPATGLAGWGFNVRASMIPEGDLNFETKAIAAGLDFGAGRGRFGVQAFYGMPDCGSCDGGGFGLGADFDFPFWSSMSDASTNNASFAIGFRPAFGWSKGTGDFDSQSAMSFGAGLPLSVTMGQSTKLVAFVTPGFAWGKIKEDGGILVGDFDESGTSMVFGGGIGVNLASGVGVNLGLNKVFVDQSETVWGLAFTWHGMPTK